MALPTSWANPATTRSRIVLEIASGLVTPPDPEQPVLQAPFIEAKVSLRVRGKDRPPLTLFGSSTIEGIWAVARGEAALGMVNPSTALALAFRGQPPFSTPLPLRTLAVIPSADQYVFAVRPQTGLTTFEAIGTRRYPLKIETRGTPDHSLHLMLKGIAAAAGFSLDALRSWGGEIRKTGGFPRITEPKIEALARGEVEALFEEGSDEWLPVALDAGMTILPLAEATVQKLEAIGYRRATIERRRYPKLPADILTVSFSGWPIFVHAELDDETVTQICRSLDDRKQHIPWQGEGPLPLDRMCRDSDATPIDTPMHPAAERFWRSRGYLSQSDDA